MKNAGKWLYFIKESIITLLLWVYFTAGFIIVFMPFYVIFLPFFPIREIAYQTLNCYFYKGFFAFARLMLPGLQIRISNEVFSVQSSIIICNHRSYLDPLLMISLYPRHKTIVKGVFFFIPIFGWILRLSGYIPFNKKTRGNAKTYEKIASLDSFFKSGGNMFIFPEGTRSKDGSIGEFKSGAFRIARLCKVPIVLFYIKNTETVFRPGNFLFNSRITGEIRVEYLSTLETDSSMSLSIKKIVREIREIYEKKQFENNL